MFEEYDWKQRGCKRTRRKRKVPAFKQKKPRRNKLNSWYLHTYTKSAEFLIIWKILIILLLFFDFEDRDAFVLVHLNSIRTNVSRLLL